VEHLIFSLNATIPVFFVIFAGWVLKKIGVLKASFQEANNTLVFRVLFPIMLFRDISQTDLNETFTAKFFFFCRFATMLCLFAVWGAALLFVKERAAIGSFVQGSIRGSAGVLGVAFAVNMYGHSGMVPLMMVAIVPVYNISAVILLSIYSSEQSGNRTEQLRQVVKDVVTNPLILGILAGVPFALLRVDFPAMADKCINNLADLTTPLALLLVGSQFDFSTLSAKKVLTAVACVIKLVIQPAVFLPLAVWMGFREQELIALLIMLGAPSTVSSYIMARNMHNDADLACGIVVITTLFSAVTVTGFIYILRVLGYV